MIRRLLTTTMAATLVAAATPVVLQAAPAHAAPQQITGATLTWGLNGYAQVGAQFGPWSFLDPRGDATTLKGSVSGGDQTEYATSPATTSMPVSSPQKTPNAIKLVGGSGTADPATGAATLIWSGSYVVNAYPKTYGAPDEIYADPTLDIAADGSGELTFSVVIGAGQDMAGNPSPAQDLGRLTVLEFAAGSDVLDGDRLRLTPTYQGVPVQESTPQDRSCAGTWGSWPAGFVNAMPDSVSPHFYSTSCGGRQNNKPPLPVDVDLGLSGQTTTTTTLSAPTTRYGQATKVTVEVPGATGTVSLRSGSTELGRTTLAGGRATITLAKRAVGSQPLTATYFGSATAAPSTASGTRSVVRATTSTAISISPRPTRTRAGKATVKVTSPTTTPTGRVSLKVRKGSSTVRSLTGTLQAGKVTLTLAKLPKGSYTLVATYATSANVTGSTRTVALKVT